MVGTVVLAGLEDDRFKGGGHDGYHKDDLIQTTSSGPSMELARFNGGSHDGYGNRTAEDLFIPPIATVLLIR